MSLRKNNRSQVEGGSRASFCAPLRILALVSTAFLALLPLAFLVSCEGRRFGVASDDTCCVIWTNEENVALYAELYNYEHPETPVVVVYKENPADSLPPAKDELVPDIVIGPWLKSTNTKKHYFPLTYLFTDNYLAFSDFYAPLLDTCLIDGRYYLLPVSFNLGAVIFSVRGNPYVADNYVITLDEMFESGKTFNKKTRSGIFTAMSFAPSWSDGFLYAAAQLRGASFVGEGNSFSWDETSLAHTVDFLRLWTVSWNESTTKEHDFQFKYLFTPAFTWASRDNVLFSYLTSDDLFCNAQEKLSDLDYRWLSQDGKALVEDDVVYMGVYKKSRHLRAAESFLLWFLNADSQRDMMDRVRSMNYVTRSFGIAGGFSSLKDVNEFVFPVHYPKLLGNVPKEDRIFIAPNLPNHWQSLKERVVVPYLKEATNTETDLETSKVTMEALLAEWSKQYFN